MKFHIRNIVILLLSFSCLASTASRNCLSIHIDEAIEMNKERRELYAEITNDQSRTTSNLLINAERIAYPISKAFDYKARKYQEEGIPLLCLDAIDMNETPAFSYQSVTPKKKYKDAYTPSITRLNEKVSKAMNKSYFLAMRILDDEVHRMEKDREYNCLTRHFIESIRRTMFLTPYYLVAARRKNLDSPKNLLENYIQTQMQTLYITKKIDQSAAKVQEKGTPIICQDVPFIPLPAFDEISSFYN